MLIIAICLLLGAVVNVAVASWRAATAEFDKQASFFVADRSGASSVPFFVMVHRRSGVGLDQVAYPPTDVLEWQRAGLEVQDSRPGLPRWAVWPREPVDKTVLYVAAGWPLKAVVCHRLGENALPLRAFPGTRVLVRSGKAPVWKDAYVIDDLARSGWKVYYQPRSPLAPDPAMSWRWRPLTRVLPLRPLPLGFAINTIVYATLLWLLIPGPFTLWRFLRVRRGLCPKCAYPMGESSVCTECGRPVPKPAAA